MSEEITIFIDGPSKDHKCDDGGDYIYVTRDGEVTKDKDAKNISAGSTTCSVCGSASINRFWEWA